MQTPDPTAPVTYFPYFDRTYLAVAASLNGGNVLATFVHMLVQWMAHLGKEWLTQQCVLRLCFQCGSVLGAEYAIWGSRFMSQTQPASSTYHPSLGTKLVHFFSLIF